MRRRLALAAIMALVTLIGGSAYYTVPSAVGEQTTSIPGAVSLVRPVFAQTSFLELEAGISAYYDVTPNEIDLGLARAAFRVIEQETSSWIIGTVGVPGFGENEDPHVFVHRQGWIIAYYGKNDPVGRIIDWESHGVLSSTKLEQAIEAVADSAGLAHQNAGFYDFRHPTATEWLLIIDRNSFQVTIPGQFSVFERSYSHRTSGFNCGSLGDLRIDGELVSRRCNGIFYGGISGDLLSLNEEHLVQLSHGESNNSVAISLLYTPPPAGP